LGPARVGKGFYFYVAKEKMVGRDPRYQNYKAVIPMKMQTRSAKTTDVPAILSLWKRFMTEEGGVVSGANPLEAEEAWTTRLRTQIADSKVVVADDGHGPVGFFAFIDKRDRDWIPAGVAYAVDIYVAPEARAGTAAKDLFHAATVLLRGEYSETWTNTHVKNKRMQVLLRRAGFEPLHNFRIEGLQDQVYYRRDNNAMRMDTRTSRR
jgi:RimJ/RimL family protein N-acetyltransferase